MRTAGHPALAGRPVGEGLPPKVSVLPVSGGLGRGENILRTVTMQWSAIQRGPRNSWGPPAFAMGACTHGFLFAQKGALCGPRRFKWRENK